MTTPNPQPTICMLLDKIPAEIRNQIYDLVFHVEVAGNLVELKDGKAPSLKLALTCKKIYEETSEMARAAYNAFWTNTRFAIDLDTPDVDRKTYIAIVQQRLATKYIARPHGMTLRYSLNDTGFEYREGEWVDLVCSVKMYSMSFCLLRNEDVHTIKALEDAGFTFWEDDERSPGWKYCHSNEITPAREHLNARGFLGERTLSLEELTALLYGLSEEKILAEASTSS